MNRLALCAAPLFGIALVAMSATAQAEEGASVISWSTGFEYSSGKYGGTEEIEDLYVPLTARLSTSRLSFELTVPYLSVTAPSGTTVTEPGNEPVSGSGPTATESGLGDVIAGVTLYDVFYSDALGMALDLTGKVKFGTADEMKGLGTGEQDFAVRADMYKFYEQFTLMGSAGYKFRGDPADIDLENVFLGSVGAAVSLSEKSRIGLMYDYRKSALADGDAISEVSAFLSRSLNDTWYMQIYAFSGFSDSSADWGAGIMFEIS
ncbi:MAG: hypothetical protein ACR2RD_16730 [Woeseiaceae bacterium]